MKALSWLAWVPLFLIGLLAFGTGAAYIGWVFWVAQGESRVIAIIFVWLTGLGAFVSLYTLTAYRKTENHFTNKIFLIALGIVLALQTYLLVESILLTPRFRPIDLSEWFVLSLDVLASILWVVAAIAYARFRRALSAEQMPLAHLPPNDNL
ncbi:hypothetical protein HYR54_00245 [Candidatus Acetothermia bacterium]|nr:hypothetical protein [Candidatus Acetothermia bacterium]